jgi:hypothetical protein
MNFSSPPVQAEPHLTHPDLLSVRSGELLLTRDTQAASLSASIQGV